MPSVEGVSAGASEVLGDSWYPDENTQAAASNPKPLTNESALVLRRLGCTAINSRGAYHEATDGVMALHMQLDAAGELENPGMKIIPGSV